MSFRIQNNLANLKKTGGDEEGEKKVDPIAVMSANIEALTKQVGALVAWSGEVKEKLGMD